MPIIKHIYETKAVRQIKYEKGIKKSNQNEQEYWFNSENQFLSHVLQKESKVITNSYTYLEEESLYNYNEINYKNPPPHLLFYICRN